VNSRLGLGLFLFALAYAVLYVLLGRSAGPTDADFESAGLGRPLFVYVDLAAVNPVRQEAQLQLYFADDNGPHGKHFSGSPARDVLITVSDGDSEKDIQLRAHEPIPTVEFLIGLTGSVNAYPFDRYAANFSVKAYEGTRPDAVRAVPVTFTLWASLYDWAITPALANQAGDGIRLDLNVRRAKPIVFFAFMTYAAMALIGACAITIGGLVFLGVRTLEATLTGALGAMVFALPVLHSALPGAPPLGVGADILIFLWAEIAATTGLALLVYTWARGTGGARP